MFAKLRAAWKTSGVEYEQLYGPRYAHWTYSPFMMRLYVACGVYAGSSNLGFALAAYFFCDLLQQALATQKP